MMSDIPSDAPSLFNALLNGRGTMKEAAIRTIDRRESTVNHDHLRHLIMTALKRDFRPPKPRIVEDPKHADTRCWLVSALGRVAGDDAEAAAEVRRHLDRTYEPYAWARYWALEGLVAGGAPDLPTIAEKLAAPTTDEEPLVSSLAKVLRAGAGDENALAEIRDNFARGGQIEQWSMLRGLRVVPAVVPSLARELCAIVDAGQYNDVTFDAIVALGKLAPENQYADTAAQSLANYLITHRWPMYDSMRTKALIALGNLRVERTAPVLIEELSEDSPAIVYEASRALEKVIGVRTTTARLLEAATRIGPDAVTKFATALRWMDRNAVVEALEIIMLTASDAQQEFARALLSEVGGQYAFQKLQARTAAANKYTGALEQAEEKIRKLFEDSIREAQHGFTLATRMDLVVFGLGIGLIVASATMLMVQGKTLDSWVGVGLTGGVGVLGVLYSLLIARPREQVRQAVDHLMYLKVIFLGYLRQLHQSDQAYTRRLLDDKPFSVSEVTQFADMVSVTMAAAIAQLSAHGAGATGAAASTTPQRVGAAGSQTGPSDVQIVANVAPGPTRDATAEGPPPKASGSASAA
jgi:hypothetical protein